MPYLDSLDIANRAMQFLGAMPIETVDEDSVRNREARFAYDKLRREELRRNVWRFARRNVVLRPLETTTKFLNPVEWNEDTNYQLGSLVKDENGYIWMSTIPDNRANIPDETTAWEAYFGPMTAHLYDEDTTYWAGEVVYKAIGSGGGYGVFMSLESTNDDVPTTADAWSATVTYARDESVSYSGSQWRSLIEVNLNHTPTDGPAAFDVAVTYSAGQSVTGSDGFIYTSDGNGNVGNDPVSTSGYWTSTGNPNAWDRTPEIYATARTWLPLYAAAERMIFPYPIGSGPVSNADTLNVFRLPANYLRRAPQAPKMGSVSPLGAPAGLPYTDEDIKGNYVLTTEFGPKLFEFVADITDVRVMDDMFCGGLAARVALACTQTLTQSSTKKQDIAGEYQKFMSEARIVNAIEIGPVESPEDDYLMCRQ